MIDIVYKPYVTTNSLTGNTINYSSASSAITSNIYISSGFTLNLNGFDRNQINRVDIIDNIINYVSDSVNKYQLDILIVNSGETQNITQIGDYCIKISYSGETFNYLMMNVINDISSYDSIILYIPSNINYIDNSDAIEVVSVVNNSPIIYYNSGSTWLGSGTTIPYNVYLDLLSGWTLDSLRTLFISGVTGCYEGNIPLSAVTFIVYKNCSNIPLTGIFESGIYNIFISYTDSADRTTSNTILSIKVDDEPPIIVYKPYVFTSYLTGNTIIYSGASSAITSDILIESGFTLNLNGFDNNYIGRMDLIENIINYAYDEIDININKYMINFLVAGKHNDNGPIVYTGITLPGEYCVKISLSDSSGNEIIKYFMMMVIYDVSTYSEGYWQDDKVWIDSIHWLDHPIIPER